MCQIRSLEKNELPPGETSVVCAWTCELELGAGNQPIPLTMKLMPDPKDEHQSLLAIEMITPQEDMQLKLIPDIWSHRVGHFIRRISSCGHQFEIILRLEAANVLRDMRDDIVDFANQAAQLFEKQLIREIEPASA